MLVAAIKWSIGKPIDFARIPAHIFPKFPLGTEKIFLLLFLIFLYAKK